LIWRDRAVTYGELTAAVEHHQARLNDAGCTAGSVLLLAGEFSPVSVALLLAAIRMNAIVALAQADDAPRTGELAVTAMASVLAIVDADDRVRFESDGRESAHPLYARVREARRPGLVLFSSGATGGMKAAVHDFATFLRKFAVRRHDLRTLPVLQFSHVGGLDTLFYVLANASALVVPDSRDPAAVCAAIERHRVEVLAAAPSFLNLLALTKAAARHDLGSLVYITYGAEVMPPRTLRWCAETFPHAVLLQKYGTTETGTLWSRSRASDSPWVRLGGDGYACRVVDGALQIKADAAMLGYLNAPSPFTDDGWFQTGDAVDVDGEFIRIKGRAADVINVGGEKVHPAEVEAVIREVENVADVAVAGEPHAFVGAIVVARVKPNGPEEPQQLRDRVRRHCASRLDQYKVPAKIVITPDELVTSRFKVIRR